MTRAQSVSSPILFFLTFFLLLPLTGLAEAPKDQKVADQKAEKPQSVNLRLGDDVVPNWQAVHLTLDPALPDYSGKVRIELKVNTPTKVFHFHSEGQEFQKVTLRTKTAELKVRTEKLGDDVVALHTEEELPVGLLLLEIEFTSNFGTSATGLYRAEVDGESYSFTQFEADDAREAFPCWDEPRFKIPYQMTLTVPNEHRAVSNMPLTMVRMEDGMRTETYAKSPPMPSYLVALATGPLDYIPIQNSHVKGRIYTVKGQSHLAGIAGKITPRILKTLEEWFGSPYPYTKLDFIAIPEFWPGGMENPGLVAYADRILLVDPKNAGISQRRSQARVITHELAHMWFGNLVTMEWWDDLWLNESFTDWIADKITHELFPRYRLNLSNAQAAQGVMVGDARLSAVPIRQPIEPTDSIFQDLGQAYSKGKTILGMFEKWIGEDTFRRGVQAYLKEHAWGNTQAEDLWTSLDKSLGKKGGGVSVSTAMASFLDQPGLPEITIAAEDGKIRLSQNRFHNYGTEVAPLTWQVPVTLRFAYGDKIKKRVVLLGKDPVELQIGEAAPAWIYPNGGAYGYYRWTMPAEQLLALTQGATKHLHGRERIELIGNLSALLQAGVLDGGTYLELLGNLADDPEPLVMQAWLGALRSVEFAFVSADLEDEFAEYVVETLSPVLERIGTEPRPDEGETVALVRSSLISFLGNQGRDSDLRKEARKKAKKWLKDADSLDPALVGITLRLAARDGDAALFDSYRKRFEGSQVPIERGALLNGLGSFDDPKLQDRALDYALGDQVRPTEIFQIAFPLSGTAQGRDRLFRFVTEEWDVLTGRLPEMFRGMMPQVGGGCSAERLAEAEAFFTKPENAVPGTQRTLEKVREQVQDCLELRKREGEAVSKFLTEGNIKPSRSNDEEKPDVDGEGLKKPVG